MSNEDVRYEYVRLLADLTAMIPGLTNRRSMELKAQRLLEIMKCEGLDGGRTVAELADLLCGKAPRFAVPQSQAYLQMTRKMRAAQRGVIPQRKITSLVFLYLEWEDISGNPDSCITTYQLAAEELGSKYETLKYRLTHSGGHLREERFNPTTRRLELAYIEKLDPQPDDKHAALKAAEERIAKIRALRAARGPFVRARKTGKLDLMDRRAARDEER